MFGDQVGDEEAEAMLIAYCRGQMKTDIARAFNRPITTVRSVLHRLGGDEKREITRKRVERRAIKTATQDLAESLENLREIEAQLMQEFKDGIKAGSGSGIPAQVRIDALVKLIERKMKLLGITEPAPQTTVNVQVNQQTVNVSVEDLRAELAELEAMHARALELEAKPVEVIEEKKEDA